MYYKSEVLVRMFFSQKLDTNIKALSQKGVSQAKPISQLVAVTLLGKVPLFFNFFVLLSAQVVCFCKLSLKRAIFCLFLQTKPKYYWRSVLISHGTTVEN